MPSSTQVISKSESEWGVFPDRAYLHATAMPNGKAQVVHSWSAPEWTVPPPARSRPAARPAFSSRSATLIPILEAGPSNFDKSSLPSTVHHATPRPAPPYAPQSLDGIMYQDLRTYYRRSMPSVSSPLTKGVLTVVEGPPTPPASPEPEEHSERSLSSSGSTDAERPNLLKNSIRLLRRTVSMTLHSSTPDLSKRLSMPPDSRRSAPASIRNESSRYSQGCPARPEPPRTLSGVTDPSYNWFTSIGTPTFSRYHLGPNVVLPLPRADRVLSSAVRPQQGVRQTPSLPPCTGSATELRNTKLLSDVEGQADPQKPSRSEERETGAAKRNKWMSLPRRKKAKGHN